MGVLAARQRLPRDLAAAHVAALFCDTLPFALFGIGEQTVDSGVAGVLNATTPLWSVLVGLALGERFTGVRLTGLGGLRRGPATEHPRRWSCRATGRTAISPWAAGNRGPVRG